MSALHIEEVYQVTACSRQMKKLNRELRYWKKVYASLRGCALIAIIGACSTGLLDGSPASVFSASSTTRTAPTLKLWIQMWPGSSDGRAEP